MHIIGFFEVELLMRTNTMRCCRIFVVFTDQILSYNYYRPFADPA
jgi:hypothetical protein